MNRDRRMALLLAYPLLTIHYSLPQNKKPGVERRVQPPTLRWLHAMLDFVLACARKEPHYRIYFLAFACPYAGKTLLRPDCDAPAGSTTPEPFVTIPDFFFSSSPRNNYFCRFPQPCGRCAKADRMKVRSV